MIQESVLKFDINPPYEIDEVRRVYLK